MRVIIAIAFFIFGHSLHAQRDIDTIRIDSACFILDQTTVNTDTIPLGPTHEFSYTLFNCGLVPIRFVSVKSSCGCIAIRWSNARIQAGDSAKIDGYFLTRDRPGRFNKSISVQLSTGHRMVLFVKGFVREELKSENY